jgi:hypothetical protein
LTKELLKAELNQVLLDSEAETGIVFEMHGITLSDFCVESDNKVLFETQIAGTMTPVAISEAVSTSLQELCSLLGLPFAGFYYLPSEFNCFVLVLEEN